VRSHCANPCTKQLSPLAFFPALLSRHPCAHYNGKKWFPSILKGLFSKYYNKLVSQIRLKLASTNYWFRVIVLPVDRCPVCFLQTRWNWEIGAFNTQCLCCPRNGKCAFDLIKSFCITPLS
jgi:hypothetical protein